MECDFCFRNGAAMIGEFQGLRDQNTDCPPEKDPPVLELRWVFETMVPVLFQFVVEAGYGFSY